MCNPDWPTINQSIQENILREKKQQTPKLEGNSTVVRNQGNPKVRSERFLVYGKERV